MLPQIKYYFCFILIHLNVMGMAQVVLERANSQSNSKNINCLSCAVNNPGNAIDADDESFSTLSITSAIAGAFIEQTLIFPSGACSFDTLWVILENTKVASDKNLIGVNLTSFNGNTSNNDKQTVTLTEVLPNGRTRVGFLPQFNYDRISISLNVGLLDAVTNLRIYFGVKYTPRPLFIGVKPICQNSSINLKAYIPGKPNAIFSWYDSPQGGSALFSGDSSLAFNSPIISSNRTFYVDRCSPNNSLRTPVAISIIPLPNAPTINGDIDLCKGQNTLLTANGTKGEDYRWYKDSLGGNCIFVGKTFNTGPLNSNQKYFIESVVTSDSCISLSRTGVLVKVLSTNNIPSAALSDTICEGDFAVLKALSPDGADFLWYENQVGGEFVFNGPEFTTPILSESKTFWLESFINSCGSSPQRTPVKVFVRPRPETPVANSIEKVCKGSIIEIQGSCNTIGAKLSWWDAPRDGNKLKDGDKISFDNVQSNFSIFLESELNTCSSNLRKRVDIQVKAIPEIPELYGLQQVCNGNASVLNARSSDINAVFIWKDKLGNTIYTGSKFLTPPLFDSVNYWCQVEVDGCFSQLSKIHIDISKILSPPIITCGAKTATNVSFVWDSVPGAKGYLVSVGGGDFINPNGELMHTVGNLKPNDTASVRVISIGLPPCDSSMPSERFVCRSLSCGSKYFSKFGEQKVCKGDSITLFAKGITTNNYSISWNGEAPDTIRSYTFKPDADEIISFEILDKNQPFGCPYQQELIPIKVSAKPVISMRAKPNKVIIPNPVQFFDETSGDETYYWDFGDGTNSTERNPIKFYDKPGKYDVKLIVVNAFGCEDSLLKIGFVDADYSPLITIPNSFTPNGDGLNDLIIPEIRRINTYSIEIYNTKGTKLFSAKDPMDGWDGTANNLDQPAGAYFYIIDALGSDDLILTQKGVINLLR